MERTELIKALAEHYGAICDISYLEFWLDGLRDSQLEDKVIELKQNVEVYGGCFKSHVYPIQRLTWKHHSP